MKILVAEQSDSIRQALQKAVDVLGHGALTATNIEELFELLPAHYPETALAVLDWNLPGGEGGGALEQIQEDCRYQVIPILILLEEEESVDAIAAYQAGAADCLTRACTEQDLVTRMLECLSRAA